MRRGMLAAVVALSMLASTVAHADGATAEPADADTVSGGRRALAAGVAAVPGAVVHGLGHFTKGDPKTARRLLAAEGIGLGMTAGGLVGLFLTGASRKVVMPLATLTFAGAGLFFTSYLADIYGSANGCKGGAPALAVPLLVTEAGLRYVHDPTFSYRAFFVQAIELTVGRLRLRPEGWHALDDRNERLRATAAIRFVGPRPRAATAARDGSFVDLESAITHHAFLTERFRITTGEVLLRGRYDGARIGPSLAGSFFEGSVGAAAASYAYDTGAATSDVDELLLGGFAYGVYLWRDGTAPRGEVAVYYDHRHDDFAAGLKMPGLGSGVPGHIGARGHGFFTRAFGVKAELEAGSAIVGGASLLFRTDP